MNKPRDKKGKFIKTSNPKNFRLRLTLEERNLIEKQRKDKKDERIA